MKISNSHLMKWIPADKAVEGGLHNWCFGQGIVLAEKNGHCEGFTLFKPEQINREFTDRLHRRFGSGESVLKIYVPVGHGQRLTQLTAGLSGLKIEISEANQFCLEEQSGHPTLRTQIYVMNVDDSPVILKMLAKVQGQSTHLKVLGQISDSLTAVKKIKELKPDLVTMDIQMPGLNGVQVIEALQKDFPVPALVVSSLGLEEGSMVYQALEKGAFDYVQKPQLHEIENFRLELIEKMHLALSGHATQVSLKSVKRPKANSGSFSFDSKVVWCFGASTGGTQALTRVMTSLPAHIPPTLIVQHIPPVFSKSFAHSLDNLCPFHVKEAEDGDILRPDTVYVAPGGYQMGVKSVGNDLVIRISDDAPVNRFKPSVDYMFRSVVELKGQRILAGVLTGMGKDGAEGLLTLRKAGASTFAQDQESSVVYGMPRACAENGAAEAIVHLDSVSEFLLTQTQKLKKSA